MGDDRWQSYFPSCALDAKPEVHRMCAEWLTDALVRLEERALHPSNPVQPLIVRLLCLPTWSPGCSIRVNVATLPPRIVSRELDGIEAGFELGKLSRRSERVLTEVQATQFKRKWEYLRFWSLPATTDYDVLDGTTYVLEGSECGRYHVILRDETKRGDSFGELTDLLFKLSGVASR